MEVITSLSNPTVKRICSLHTSKGRKEQGLFFAEGIKILRDNSDGIVELFIRDDKEEYASYFPDRKITYVSSAVMKKMCDTETPQGVLATFGIPDRGKIVGNRVVVLDGLQDPGNVGAVIRTAVASGFSTVCVVNSASPFSPKAVRSSMGGVFRVTIVDKAAEELLTDLKDAKYALSVLDMGGENVLQCTPCGKIALVVGSEGQGVSKLFRDNADKVYAIPMAGGIESLNASVSAGIAMYRLSEFQEEK